VGDRLDPNAPFVPIDKVRTSRVLLIDGGRGSGKTTVLVTIINLLQQLMTQQEARGLHLLTGPHESRIEGAVTAIRAARRLLPLEILDLNPLPESTALLPFVVSDFYRLVSKLADPQRPESARASRAQTPAPSLTAWRNLLHATVVGWDGNIEERAASLDPETYVVEREEAEKARLRVNDQWRHFIGVLLPAVHDRWRHLGSTCRLIIPVDDADLNVAHCMDVLELLHKLWHPDVLFLLTGDSQLFRHAMLCATTERLTSTSVRQLNAEGLGLARRITFQKYDKIIPVTQRIELKPLAPEETFLRLAESLNRIELPTTDTVPPATLHTHLQLHKQLQRALPTVLRDVVGLRQWLGVSQRSLVHFLEWTWQRFTERENSTWLAGALQRSGPDHLLLGPPYLGFYTEHYTRYSVTTPLGALDFHSIFEFEARVVARDSTGDAPRIERLPDPQAEAILLLATDVAATSTAVTFKGGSSAEDQGYKPILVVARPSRPIPWRKFNWPLPDWQAPLDMRLVADALHDTLRGLDLGAELSPGLASQTTDPGLVARLGLSFLQIVCDVIESRAAQVRSVSRERPSREEWSALSTRLLILADRTHSRRAEHGARWARRRAALLAAPESGLAAEDANTFLETFRESCAARGRWDDDIRNMLRSARLRRVQLATDRGGAIPPNEAAIASGVNEATAALTEIDTAYDDHAWARMVEQRSHKLERLLSRITQSTGHGAVQLMQYLEAHGTTHALLNDLEAPNLLSRLSRAAEVPGSASAAVWLLWEAVRGRLDPSGIQAVRGGPRFEEGRLIVDYTCRVVPGAAHRMRSSTAGVETVFAEAASTSVGELNNAGGDAVGAVLILAANVAADAGDASKDEPNAQRADVTWSSLAAGCLEYLGKEIFFGWPEPSWPAPVDQWVAAKGWTASLVQAITLLDLAIPERRLVEGLAISFLDAELAVANHNREFGSRFRLDYGPGQLTRLAQGTRGLGANPTPSRHANAVARWRQVGAALLGAPESGLRAEDAQTWLDGFRDASDDDRRGVVRQRELRAEHALRAAGLPAGARDTQALIQVMDERFRGHPWQAFASPPPKRSD
jgi:hypothetical protein